MELKGFLLDFDWTRSTLLYRLILSPFVKLNPGLREHLVHAALMEHLDKAGLAFIGAEHFTYLTKQLSYKDSPTYERCVRELSKFFSDAQLDQLEQFMQNVVVPRPGVYDTQLSENESGFPEYFVYETKNPKNNFFVKICEPKVRTTVGSAASKVSGGEMAESANQGFAGPLEAQFPRKLAELFKVKLLSAEVPDELNIKLDFS